MSALLGNCSAWRLEQAALVGKGFTSEIYDWDVGRVLKLFHSWVPQVRVEREFKVTQAIHTAGLPVPAAHELVQVEGRFGIVFAQVDGVSMLSQVQSRPWTLFRAVRQLAQLHARIHSGSAPSGLPTFRERIASGIDAAPGLSDVERQVAHRSLADLPDGTALCHGDFHPENILFSSRGPVIIDWESATCGDPLGDVACTSRLMQHASLPPWTPRSMHLLLKCSRILLHRAYLRCYLRLRPASLEQIRAWEGPLAAAAGAWRIPQTVA